MLYMVTFTINIPPMLVYIYIYHTWILWVHDCVYSSYGVDLSFFGTSRSHVASFAGASTLFLRALNAQVAEALGPLFSFWSFCWSWQRLFSWLLGA